MYDPEPERLLGIVDEIFERYRGLQNTDEVAQMLLQDIRDYYRNEIHPNWIILNSFIVHEPEDICVRIERDELTLYHRKYLEGEGWL